MNPQPPVPETDALSFELRVRLCHFNTVDTATGQQTFPFPFCRDPECGNFHFGFAPCKGFWRIGNANGRPGGDAPGLSHPGFDFRLSKTFRREQEKGPGTGNLREGSTSLNFPFASIRLLRERKQKQMKIAPLRSIYLDHAQILRSVRLSKGVQDCTICPRKKLHPTGERKTRILIQKPMQRTEFSKIPASFIFGANLLSVGK